MCAPLFSRFSFPFFFNSQIANAYTGCQHKSEVFRHLISLKEIQNSQFERCFTTDHKHIKRIKSDISIWYDQLLKDKL